MTHTRFFDFWILAFCRVGVAGLSPILPGTCGSLAAILMAPVLYLPLCFPGRVLLLALLFWAGGKAATRAEHLLGRKDPGEIVIDELVGVWLVLLPFDEPGPRVLLGAFVLFRVFDMLKPQPVRASENWLPAGYGVMLDDVVAALYALAVLEALCFLNWI